VSPIAEERLTAAGRLTAEVSPIAEERPTAEVSPIAAGRLTAAGGSQERTTRPVPSRAGAGAAPRVAVLEAATPAPA